MSPKKYAFRIILVVVLAIMGGRALFAEPTPTPFPGLVVLEFPEPSASPSAQVEASPRPEPTPTPTPVPSPPPFQPDPAVVEMIMKGNPFTEPPWLFPQTTDPSQPPGVSRFSTLLISTFEPHVTKDGDIWRITFRP